MTAPGAAWHAGERALQARAGVGPRMAEIGPRVLRDYMPDQHREFFAELPFLLAGTLDARGQPQASVLAGPPGFAHSPEPRLLRIVPDAGADTGLRARFAAGEPVALLGLQAHTGRRNRMNGRIAKVEAGGFDVRVGQSFGNCPKYIHPREAVHVPVPAAATAGSLPRLDDAALRLVAAADTFFIATAHPQARAIADASGGLDVAHRGGPAGFVQVSGSATLLVPDYVGNSFFNTFGNLQLEPRCSLLFIDFATGEQLRLAARGAVLWDGPERAALPGALRVLRLEVVEALRVRGGLPLRWIER
jgi:uncharacterized protein